MVTTGFQPAEDRCKSDPVASAFPIISQCEQQLPTRLVSSDKPSVKSELSIWPCSQVSCSWTLEAFSCVMRCSERMGTERE